MTEYEFRGEIVLSYTDEWSSPEFKHHCYIRGNDGQDFEGFGTTISESVKAAFKSRPGVHHTTVGD